MLIQLSVFPTNFVQHAGVLTNWAENGIGEASDYWNDVQTEGEHFSRFATCVTSRTAPRWPSCEVVTLLCRGLKNVRHGGWGEESLSD